MNFESPEQAAQVLLNLEHHLFQRGVSGISSHGIDINWERCPKYLGGNFLRGKTWGRFKYRDIFNGKDLTRREAIALLLTPMADRRLKKELTDIEYCVMCGKTGIGEEERLRWGRLSYVYEVIERTYEGGYKNVMAHNKWVSLCGGCCQKIIKRGVA